MPHKIKFEKGFGYNCVNCGKTLSECKADGGRIKYIDEPKPAVCGGR